MKNTSQLSLEIPLNSTGLGAAPTISSLSHGTFLLQSKSTITDTLHSFWVYLLIIGFDLLYKAKKPLISLASNGFETKWPSSVIFVFKLDWHMLESVHSPATFISIYKIKIKLKKN